MKISVIVPVYKVESYIARCVRSLFEQTFSDVEYIFVDDATPDNSMMILKELIRSYPQRRESIKIVTHPFNKGLPAARNSGMKVATGDYIYHCDSDDYLDLSALEELYKTAILTNSDYVWSDWYLTFSQNKRYMKQPKFQSTDNAVRGMLAGCLKYNVWNKLVKRSLYTEHNVVFPEGYGMGEDMTMIRLLAFAEHVGYVPLPLYYYVKRDGEAFTNTWNDNHVKSVLHNTQMTVDFLTQHFSSLYEKEVAWFKLNVKLPFIISNDVHLYKLWSKYFPEANKYIWSNKNVSFRIRILQTLASWHCFGLVYLYYVIVYKFIYGIIFK